MVEGSLPLGAGYARLRSDRWCSAVPVQCRVRPLSKVFEDRHVCALRRSLVRCPAHVGHCVNVEVETPLQAHLHSNTGALKDASPCMDALVDDEVEFNPTRPPPVTDTVRPSLQEGGRR